MAGDSNLESPLGEMRIQELSFRDFRNYESLRLSSMGNLTMLVGKNAVGKTNVLEGIQLLTSAYSFRHPQIAQLIHYGSNASLISLKAGDENRLLDVALALEPGKRRYSVNGKGKSAADVRGILPSVAFTPDDLQMVKQSSSVKRAAIDNTGMQLTRNYYIVRRDFEKTVRYKNRLLKDEAATTLIESINETLVTCAAQLFCLRTALFERIRPVVADVYSQLSSGGEVFSAEYRPSWDRLAKRGEQTIPKTRDEARETMTEELNRWMPEERKRARCLVGPHADEITFMLDGRDAAAFASQGQQRSIVLAWKIAEVRMVKEVLGVQPVLLLDDVLSELDGTRRETLVQFVQDDMQTFITATDLDGFDREFIERAQVVNLPLDK